MIMIIKIKINDIYYYYINVYYIYFINDYIFYNNLYLYYLYKYNLKMITNVS